MRLSYVEYEKIIRAVTEVMAINNVDYLLEFIVEISMEIACCDGVVLCLYDENQLQSTVIKIKSWNVFQKIKGEKVDLPDEYSIQSMLEIPLRNSDNELIGVMQLFNAQNEKGEFVPFHKEYDMILHSIGSIVAMKLTNILYITEIKTQLHSFVEALATAIDERTPYNGHHTRKVAEYAGLLANKIEEKYQAGLYGEGFDEERKEKLQLAALLHDIGKMIVPSAIMNRATRLDKDIVNIQTRFQLLKAYYEIDWLKGRISAEQYKENCQELQSIMEFIERIDTVSLLDEEDYEKVQELAGKYYEKESGEKISLITKREAECLSIRKGTLTEQDRKLMENHVVMTSKILSKVHFDKNYRSVPKWAGEHHEFLDGTGYPNKLSGEELELETRILTIADIYDALTATDRPYKKPLPSHEVMGILSDMAKQGKVDKQLVVWLGEALEQQ